MSPFLRKVPTGSGATAVQIVSKRGGQRKILEHLGSAHTESELALLMQVGREKLNAEQGTLDLGLEEEASTQAVVRSTRSGILINAIRASYAALGFDEAVNDEAFFQMVLARLVEPTSKADGVRVVRELGMDARHRNSLLASLKRANERDYRGKLADKCLRHAIETGGIALLMYDVTTLYFEADDEDDLRKVGYSKERRVDPQIVVGLLVDRNGFPLDIACYEGNKAETHTFIPFLTDFIARHQIADMVVVADAGMFSLQNMSAVEEANMRFIVGSRTSKAPLDLAHHFHWHGTYARDGQIVDTLTPRKHTRKDKPTNSKRARPAWDPARHPQAWRAVWQYRRKRAVRDERTLNQQRNRALAVIDGDSKPKPVRFVQTKGGARTFNQDSYDKASDLAGWKGYVTNIPAQVMSAEEVVSSYHDLWRVEQSFRMAKSDLDARPIFHYTREAIEAHLTVVFASLAVARYMYAQTGITSPKIVKALKPLQEVTITVAGQQITANPEIPEENRRILTHLNAMP